MEYKKLGKTDLSISRIGFGCWAIGGHGYGKVDDNKSIRAINKAIDIGINFFDTADVYGFGHSEIILGQALGSLKNDVVIATKFGINWNDSGKTFKDCSPKRIVTALNGSLKRLKVDCIDLYQIHWYDNKTPFADMMYTLIKCQEGGKIRHIGCSNLTFELIRELDQIARIESLQCVYNLIEKQTEITFMKCNEELDIGILTYGVLARGLLSGKYDNNTKFDEKDTRNRDENYKGEKLKRNLKVIGELRRIADRYNKTTAQVAIRWALKNIAVTSALIGIKSVKQVVENAGGIGWKLEQADYEKLNSLFC